MPRTTANADRARLGIPSAHCRQIPAGIVRLDASFGDGWFYEGAGIYRHVWLFKTDAVHLGRWESYVRTDAQGNFATLTLGTVVQNESA